MQFDEELIKNSVSLQNIKKYYSLTKFTWQVNVNYENVNCVCFDKTSNIRNVFFLKPDSRLGIRRLEVFGYGKSVPFILICYPFINDNYDESCKFSFLFYTPETENYCVFYGSDYFLPKQFLIKIYE